MSMGGQKRHIMKHSDYLNLTRRLAFLTREADRTREFLTGEVNRGVLLRAVEAVDNEVVGLMDGMVDGFVEANQGRADQGHGATADVRALYEAMAGFLMATETPVNGSVLYPGIRKRTREWMDQATTWFPDLNAQVQADTIHQVGTIATASIDMERLKALFISRFTIPNRDSGYCPFDSFYKAIESKSKVYGYTATDWGRVGYQIRHSKYAKSKVLKPFKRWFEIVGVPVPGEPSPGAYKDKTVPTDFSEFLD